MMKIAVVGATGPTGIYLVTELRKTVASVRVIAGGALSGSTERHPIASPPPEPIGSAMSYEADVTRAGRLMPLVQEGSPRA